MELNQQLAFCKQCQKRKFDPNTGIVCSLTLRKPDFQDQCNDFEIDHQEVKKNSERSFEAQREEKSKGNNTWVIIGVVLIIIRIIIRMARNN